MCSHGLPAQEEGKKKRTVEKGERETDGEKEVEKDKIKMHVWNTQNENLGQLFP